MGKITFVDGVNGTDSEVAIDLANPITVKDFFAIKYPGADPKGYVIRVNREPARAEYILQNGDRVSVSPTKITGA